MLNVLSLILGLIAWIVPVVSLMKFERNKRRNWVLFSITSLIACASSLFVQILEVYDRVQIEDFSALTDLMRAIVWVSAVLLFVTIVLNIINAKVNRVKASH